MKLIIDIPEELYNGIECRNGELETEYVCNELMKAVDKGTPLDDVRAEIQEKSVWYRGQTYDGLCIALKIIDKYIGKESEE